MTGHPSTRPRHTSRADESRATVARRTAPWRWTYAACFESALGAVARRRHQEAGDVAIDSSVMLVPTKDRAFNIAVALAVTLPSIDDADEAVELVRAAHQVCPYSNATRGNIEVSLSANGRGVEQSSEPVTS